VCASVCSRYSLLLSIRSISIAPPWPPPMHRLAMPFWVWVVFRMWARWRISLAPLAPTGWPMAIAPPLMLSFVMSSFSIGPSSPSSFRQ